jgi:hypothetical protein
VEPLFGEAKDWHGLRRFRLRRLEKVNIEALLIASGQNIKRLVAARERGPRKLAQAAALRPPHPVSRCRSHVSGRWPTFAGAKAYFNRLASLVKLAKLCEEIEESTNGTYANVDEKIDQLTHVAKTAFDAKSAIEAELFPRTKSRLIRKAWPHSQFAVTVLEGERIIAFEDPPPSRATFTQNQTIRGNREGLREYWCWLDDTPDNGTMENLTVDDKPPPSSLIDARPGLMRVGKRFSHPLAQGEETQVNLCCDLVDAFRTKGQYTFKILRMSKKELFKLQFHREKRCHSIKVFRSYGRVREKLVKEQHFGPDDGEVFEYVVDSPNFGEVYRFEWDW